MNRKIFSAAVLLLLLATTSCRKSFNDLYADPNRATSVPANLVLNSVLLDFTSGAFNYTQRANQYYACNYNYYGNNEYNWTGYSFSAYATLKNIQKMEEESIKSVASPNPYTALGKFLRAYFLYSLTMNLGDIPASEALKGIENVQPKYDSQKDVFRLILQLLEESNAQIATITQKNYVLANDFYFGNNLFKWQKAVNAFKLRVLIQLSRRESDADLAIKQKFSETLSQPTKYPLFLNDGESLMFVYNNQYNKYSTNPDNFGFDATRYNMSATYLGNLTLINDPRTFYVAEPAAARLSAGSQPTDFAAFVGAPMGEDLATMSANAVQGKYSYINRKRYYQTYTAEKTYQIGYPEMCFNIAEAAHRGWITNQNAETWYQNGIKASLAFYGVQEGNNTVTFQRPGGGLFESVNYVITFNYNNYYNQNAVKYAGATTAGLNQILLQRYLAMYQNSGQEAYFNWRRTGIPLFHTGPGSGNSQRVALRYQYPSVERTVNATNLTAALAAQYGGTDDINASMWIIK